MLNYSFLILSDKVLYFALALKCNNDNFINTSKSKIGGGGCLFYVSNKNFLFDVKRY